MIRLEKSHILLVTGFALSLLILAAPSLAATTGWHESYGGKLRLIAGGNEQNQLKAGLEIVLDEGWKTYWKVPGDSGIPPLFDESASKNVAKIRVIWPVPQRFAIGNTEMLGYKEAIIFPILITPEDPSQSVEFKLNAQVGLCSEVCVPVSADLLLKMPAGGERDLGSELLIDRDMAIAPTLSRAGFEITSVEHQKQQGHPDKLLIHADIPDGYGKKDLFVEGPHGWLLPLTRPIEGKVAANQLFELVLEGLPKGQPTKDGRLIFTLTNGEEAVEQTIRLEK